MIFETELNLLKEQISNASDDAELEYLKATNEKKYWWTSIFVAGLFYGLNGKVSRMILAWIVGFITLGIYALWIIYTSYRDQKEFNNEMELAILNRKKELKNKNPQIESNNSKFCSKCGTQLNTDASFCPNCGEEL